MTADDKKQMSPKSLGRIKKEDSIEIELMNRKIIVWIREYESGNQRCGGFFCDKNRTHLTRQNILLRKRIQELENKPDEKKEVFY